MAGTPRVHTWFDDLQGFLIGAVLTSLGVTLMAASGLVSGGTAGVAFLAHYQFGWNLGLCFVLVNLPFFLFSMRRLGGAFAALEPVATVLGWSAALWGAFLYWWAGILYLRETIRVVRISPGSGPSASDSLNA